MPPNIKRSSPVFHTGELVPPRDVPIKPDNEDSNDTWMCPASAKSLRTTNPIRAIVDPIVASSVKSGEERGDGKGQISLAVSDVASSEELINTSSESALLSSLC